MIEPVAYANVGHSRRTGEPQVPWEPEVLESTLYDRAMHPQYTGGTMIHMPQGWINTMSSAPWLGLPEGHGAVYTDVLGRVIAERPGHKWTLYSGWQMSNAYTTYGRPRPNDGAGPGFIGEPDWADSNNPQHVRMLRDLNVQEWADRGVTKFVFDSGSKNPIEIAKWQLYLRTVVKTVGMEAIPWLSPAGAPWDVGEVDWMWCEQFGLEIHGNQRYRNGAPFLEAVPSHCVGKAFVWLVHILDGLTAQDVADMMFRGWTPVVAATKDQLMADAMAIYTATTDDPVPDGVRPLPRVGSG